MKNPKQRSCRGLKVAAIIAMACCASSRGRAATAPRYGGTLVVELHTPGLVLDPVQWKIGAAENTANTQIAAALFDRLVTLDRFGRFQPALATEWSHDASWRRWQFSLRPSVQFSDGSPLTAADVAAALQELLAAGSSSERIAVTGSGMHVVLQFASSAPDLLARLASGRYFIYRRNADGTLSGTGPFFATASTPAAGGAGTVTYRFAANDRCWAGRPFVDGMEVSVGMPALRQLFDLQLGKADVVEIAPELVRRAAQENLRMWTSAPTLLYALQVNSEGRHLKTPAQADVPTDEQTVVETGRAGQSSVSEALSLALDRGTMANVLLQRQAEPAASFLPQWLSGYASVFGTESDVERARKISSALFVGPRAPGGGSPLRLRVDAAGDLAKLIAERVAINAREAGIPVQIQSRSAGRESAAGAAANASSKTAGDGGELRLITWSYSSLSVRAELDAMVTSLQLWTAEEDSTVAAEDAEHLFLREQRLIAKRGLIPLVVMPEYIGLGATVRDWMPERWGEWHLADVWLDARRAGTSMSGMSGTEAPGPETRQVRTLRAQTTGAGVQP